VQYKKGFDHFKKTGKGPLIGKFVELKALRKDKSEFPIGLSLSAAKVKDQWISIGIVRDITQIKKDEAALRNTHFVLERKVEQRTAELKKANDELSEANNDQIESSPKEENRRHLICHSTIMHFFRRISYLRDII
jgi:hypothetical protein